MAADAGLRVWLGHTEPVLWPQRPNPGKTPFYMSGERMLIKTHQARLPKT